MRDFGFSLSVGKRCIPLFGKGKATDNPGASERHEKPMAGRDNGDVARGAALDRYAFWPECQTGNCRDMPGTQSDNVPNC